MTDIIIVCAGGYGLEVYTEILGINAKAEREGKETVYNVLGFINDIPNALEGKHIEAKIIGSIQDWQPGYDEVYALGLSDPEGKKKVSSLLKSRGARFESIISVYAHVGKDVIMGEGCVVTTSTIGSGVRLGSFVNVNGSMIYGGATIGDYSTTTGFTVVEEATVGESVFIGSKAVISKDCVVGDGAKISAGSLVQSDVPKGALMFGMPAKQMN